MYIILYTQYPFQWWAPTAYTLLSREVFETKGDRMTPLDSSVNELQKN